jgi:hypothetical protein
MPPLHNVLHCEVDGVISSHVPGATSVCCASFVRCCCHHVIKKAWCAEQPLMSTMSVLCVRMSVAGACKLNLRYPCDCRTTPIGCNKGLGHGAHMPMPHAACSPLWCVHCVLCFQSFDNSSGLLVCCNRGSACITAVLLPDTVWLIMAAAGNWKSKLAVRSKSIPSVGSANPDLCSQVTFWLGMRAGCLCGGLDLRWNLPCSICSTANSVRRSRAPGTCTGSHIAAATAAAGSMLSQQQGTCEQASANATVGCTAQTYCDIAFLLDQTQARDPGLPSAGFKKGGECSTPAGHVCANRLALSLCQWKGASSAVQTHQLGYCTRLYLFCLIKPLARCNADCASPSSPCSQCAGICLDLKHWMSCEHVTHRTSTSIPTAAAAAAAAAASSAAALSCVCCTPGSSCKQACGATLSQPASKGRQTTSSKTADTS